MGHAFPDLWAPLTVLGTFDNRPAVLDPDAPAPVDLVGRLKAGKSSEQARTALSAWMERLTPEKMPRASVISVATAMPMVRNFKPMLPIGITFLLVLLSAGANVANMMLARAMSRQRETGIRLSIGAGRGRLIRQLLTESLLLAIPAALLAFAVSQALLEGGKRLVFSTIPPMFIDQARMVPLAPDVHVFWFMLGAAILVAMLFGLAPALQATRLNVMQAARGDFSSDFRPARLRNALVVAQVTVCAFLLIACAVLLRGVNHVEKLTAGIRTRDIVEIEVPEAARAHVLERLRGSAEVQSLAASLVPPLDAMLPEISASGARGGVQRRIAFQRASPEFFATLGIPILRGRTFAPEDSGAPVAIVSESAARKLWPSVNALGQTIYLDMPDRRSHSQTLRVIGVVRDAVAGPVDRTDRSCIYGPTTTQDSGNVLLARVSGVPQLTLRAISAEIGDSESGIHVLQDYLDAEVWGYRLSYWISEILAGIALLLTLSGVYGVLSYLVAQRTKEMGIRIALGAGAHRMIGLVLKQCGTLAGIGIVLGSALAAAASKFYAALLANEAGMDPFDRIAYLGGIAAVLAACLAAAYIPARRASRIDPITTLRCD